MKTFYKKVVMWLFVGQWAMSALQAQHLTAYEYWFDDQIAGRTQVRQNQRSSELLLTDSVLVSGLSTGIHRLNLRFKNDSAWSSVQQSFFLKSDAAVSDAVLVEYWLDSDMTRRFTQTMSGVLMGFDSVSLPALRDGFHTLSMRFRQSEQWSSVTQSTFMKQSQGATAGSVVCEYWLDDPRQGVQQQVLPFQSGAQIIWFDSLNVQQAAVGIHSLNVRFKQGADWSSVTQSLFMKQSQGATAGSVVCEYWLDDPRQGVQQQVLPFQLGAQIIWFDSLNVQQAAAGIHSLNVRFKQGTDWSAVSQSFFLKSALPNATIACEYWFDDALTRRKSLPLTPLQNWVVLDSVLTDSLTQGMHRLNLRFRGQSDWSAVSQHAFYKLPAPSSNQAVLCEYWFNREVQRRQTQWLRANDVLFIDSVNVSHLCSGQNVLNTRFLGGDGWSAVTRDTFRKQSPTLNMPYADFSFRLSADSYTVYFADSSRNIVTHVWDFGDGSREMTQINPAHRYTIPGVYQVCRKIGNPNTFPCQTDSICKEVTIRGISDLYPKRVANTIQNIINISGFGFTRNATVQFVQGNQIVNVDSLFWTNDRSIRTDVQFSNTMTGRWTLRMIQGNDTFRLQDTLTVEPMQTHNLTLTIEGPPSVLINREFDYKVTVRNRSNVTAFAIPLLIEVDAKKKVRLIKAVNYKNPLIADSTINRVKDTTGFLTFRDTITNDSIKYASYFIPFIRSDATYTILFKVKAVETSATKIRATVAAPFGDTSTLRRLDIPISRRELAPQGVCDFPFLSDCQNAVKDLALEGVGNIPSPIGFAAKTFGIICTIGDVVDDWKRNGNLKEDHFGLIPIATDVLGAFVESSLGAPPPRKTMDYKAYMTAKAFTKNTFSAVGFGVGMAAAAKKVSDSCSKKPDTPPGKQEMTPDVRASYDPNLKVGPIGQNQLNCVNIADVMPFTIYYENADSATAPASEVYVIDTLDGTKFDISTFRFTEFAFGDSIYYLQTAAKSFVRDIDFRPRKNIILRVSGDLDSTGIVQWSFKSFDPHTMDLTQNIDDGFLPPNRRKPEGEGKVGYTIRLRTGLPHLTTIRNKADIIFDVNAPIVTPTWTNTVDRVPPVSRVTHIARTARDTVFTVHWTGVDPHAGILDYTVYVSENGSPFMEWLANTSSDSAQFIGTRGRIYDFYVRARDYVGNIETKLPLAEASTGRVSTEPVPVAANWLGQNRPNPSSGTTQIDFYLAEYASKVQLDVYNLAGIKVKTVLNHAFVSGLHTVSLDLKGLPTGIYFYRLETDAFNETKRMLIVD